MRLARARSSNPLRHLRNFNMVVARSRDPPHVRGANGMRSAQLPTQENDQRRATETYVQRILLKCALIPIAQHSKTALKLHQLNARN